MKKKEISGEHVIDIQIKKGIWQPETFINITANKVNLDKMIKNNHLRMKINGESYWIPFIKGEVK
jgi:hypothetical protein